MSTHAELLLKLSSYSSTDWTVSINDEWRILKLIRSDPDIDTTIIELINKNHFDKLLHRVKYYENKKVLVQLLAGKITDSNYSIVSKYVANNTTHSKTFEISYQVQAALKKHGFYISPPHMSSSLLSDALSKLDPPFPESPFSGSGATGIHPKKTFISLIDQALLVFEDPATEFKYGNPVYCLSSYLSKLTNDQRKVQAITLLKRPIVSYIDASYCGTTPTRADIIRAAANKYNLEPALIAAILLAEQRDQSQVEDAKDYKAATSLFQANTSNGLGQVQVNTAKKHRLFSDLLPPYLENTLSHNEIATMLTSDEFNIYAVAKFTRHVADAASSMDNSSLPASSYHFPGLRLHSYKNNSSLWPDDNIRALASEYTSIQWDDSLALHWSNFVFEAYKDIKKSGAI